MHALLIDDTATYIRSLKIQFSRQEQVHEQEHNINLIPRTKLYVSFNCEETEPTKSSIYHMHHRLKVIYYTVYLAECDT